MLSLGANLLTSLSDGPPIIDIQRNYAFSATLFKTDWNFSGVSTYGSNVLQQGASVLTSTFSSDLYRYLNPIVMIPNLEYISGLIQKVSQPQQNILTKDIELGPVTIQVPKAITLESFQITFIEEIMGSVEYFWRNWFLEMTGKASLTFLEVRKLCLSFLFTRNAQGIIPGAEAPVNAYFYPNVLPISYEIDDWDKGGETYVASTITFIRIPKLPDLTKPTTAAQTYMANINNGIHP